MAISRFSLIKSIFIFAWSRLLARSAKQLLPEITIQQYILSLNLAPEIIIQWHLLSELGQMLTDILTFSTAEPYKRGLTSELQKGMDFIILNLFLTIWGKILEQRFDMWKSLGIFNSAWLKKKYLFIDKTTTNIFRKKRFLIWVGQIAIWVKSFFHSCTHQGNCEVLCLEMDERSALGFIRVSS